MGLDIQKEVDTAIALLNSRGDITEEKIDNYTFQTINVIRNLEELPLLSEDELKRINTKIKSRLIHKVAKTNNVLKLDNFENWFREEKVNIELNYWDRYKKYLIGYKQFTENVVNNIDDVTDDIIDLVGNPKSEKSLVRRGLIIGDVQSGKTSNFIGLMCKAADVGYKLIVVLAGTTNELRKQTQSRVDEGLVGYDSDLLKKKERKRIGAGCYGTKEFRPITGTTLTDDFSKSLANQLGLGLNQANETIVLVIKKNVSVLENLNKWLSGLNNVNEHGKIEESILVVDDEADYASIDTNKEDCNPTKTNQKILELLSLFTRESYVGFTATPFANIFIDPENNKDNNTLTLYPRDYIYCLDAPSNYIGAKDLFTDNDDDYADRCIQLIPTNESDNKDSIINILPLVHKKDSDFDRLPNTLKIAIQEFMLANAIRDLWDDNSTHRSMLVNVSRFVNMHSKVSKEIEHYVNSVRRSIMYCSKMDDEFCLNDNNMYELHETYLKEYSSICEDEEIARIKGVKIIRWKDIKNILYDSTSRIIVRIVNNSTKDKIDYAGNKDRGLRVIAVGGVSLSRGLTLEGLMVSYFYRNSSAYDTLMQMGRWFGYRDGYKDLCRIWMTDEAKENYISINRATEELKNLITQYKNSDLTPMDFGLRVRTDSNLLITARNKMRTAKEELMECTLSSKIIETRYLYDDENIIKRNYSETVKFVNSLNEKYTLSKNKLVSPFYGFNQVDWREIVEFIQNLTIPFANVEFQNEALIDFIKGNLELLKEWDVAFAQGNGNNKVKIGAEVIKCPIRKFDIKPNTNLIRISGCRCRVGSPSDGRYGMSLDDINKLMSYKKNTLSQNEFFGIGIQRRPLLVVYFTELILGSKNSMTQEEIGVKEISEKTPIVAIGVGIPYLGKNQKLIKYALNKVEQGLKERHMEFDEDGDNEE